MARIVIAYDRTPGSLADYMKDAEVITSLLNEFNVVVKIGLETMTATRDRNGRPFGTSIAEMMRMLVAEANGSILWDAKFKDIGNTVERAVANIAGSVHAVTVRADRKPEWLAKVVAARDAAAGANPTRRTQVFGVTLLTDTGEEECDYLYSARPRVVVEKRVRALLSAGFDGLVCSAQELEAINSLDPDHKLGRLVPGTRLPGADTHDQARVTTPREAAERGADLLVFGRPIWEHPKGPKAGVEAILEHLT